MWARQYPVTDAAQEAEVDKGTAIDVYQWFREEADGKQQENSGSLDWLTLCTPQLWDIWR